MLQYETKYVREISYAVKTLESTCSLLDTLSTTEIAPRVVQDPKVLETRLVDNGYIKSKFKYLFHTAECSWGDSCPTYRFSCWRTIKYGALNSDILKSINTTMFQPQESLLSYY